MKVIGFEEHYKLPAIQEANRDNPGELVFDVWKKAGRFETDAQGGWPSGIEPPRDVRRLHFLGRLGSCQVVRRGGTRRSCGSGRCG